MTSWRRYRLTHRHGNIFRDLIRCMVVCASARSSQHASSQRNFKSGWRFFWIRPARINNLAAWYKSVARFEAINDESRTQQDRNNQADQQIDLIIGVGVNGKQSSSDQAG